MRVLAAPLFVVMLVCSLAPLAMTRAALLPHVALLAAQNPVVVTITGVGADPQVVTVTSGTPVEWRNRDDRAHTITADDGSFGAIQLNDGDTSNAVVPPPGLHGYHIDSVSNVTGTLVVQDSAEPPTATSTAGNTVAPTSAPSTTAVGTSPASVTATDIPAVTDTARPTGTPAATGSSTSTPIATAPGTAPTAGACTATTVTPTNTTPSMTMATQASSAPAAPVAPVTITGGTLDPDIVTVTAGMSVQWTNRQTFPVTVTLSGGFVLGPIGPQASASHQFAQTGKYQYYVEGTSTAGLVVVQQAAVPGATATDIPPMDTATGTVVDTTITPARCTATPTALSTATAIPTSAPTVTGAPTTSAAPAATTGPTVTPTIADPATPASAITPTPASSPRPTDGASPAATTSPTAVPTITNTATLTATSAATATANSTRTWTATPPTTTATPPVSMDTASPSAGVAPITITGTGFDPREITVTVGTDVQWTNLLPYPVTVSDHTSTDPNAPIGFVVGPIEPQHAADHRFTRQGRYQYYLQGTQWFGLVVVQSEEGFPTPTSSGMPPATPTASATQPALPERTATTTDTPTSAPTATPSPTSTPPPSPTRASTVATTPSATGIPVLATTPTIVSIPPATSSPTPSATVTTVATVTAAMPATALPPATASPPAAPSATALVAPPATIPPDAPTVAVAFVVGPAPSATPPAVPAPSTATAANPAPTAIQPLMIPARTATPTTAPSAPTSTGRGTPYSAPRPTPTVQQKAAHQTAAPRRATPSSRSPAPQHTRATMELSANGQVWCGRTRVDLALSVGLYSGHARGRLRVRDVAAHRTLTSQRIDRLRPTGQGMVITGLVEVGHRAVPFTLDAETAGRTTTITLTIVPLRYRIGGPFHGRFSLHVLHAPAPPATRNKPNGGRRRPNHAHARKGRSGR